jgi:hypothetical protein
MSDTVQTFIDHASPEDYHALHDAADAYIHSIPDSEIHAIIRHAAERAIANWDGGSAWRLRDLISKAVTYPPVVKRGAVLLVMTNPQILKHFSPEFAEGVVRGLNGHAAH